MVGVLRCWDNGMSISGSSQEKRDQPQGPRETTNERLAEIVIRNKQLRVPKN